MSPKAFLVFLNLAQKYLEKSDFSVDFKQVCEKRAKKYYHHTLCIILGQDKTLSELQKDIAPFIQPQILELFQCDNRFWAYALVNAFQNTQIAPKNRAATLQLSSDLKKNMPKSKKNNTTQNISSEKIIKIFQDYLNLLKLTNQQESIQAIHSLFYYLRTLCMNEQGALESHKVDMLSTHFSAALVQAMQINIFENPTPHLAQLYQLGQKINACLLNSHLFAKAYIPPLPIREVPRNDSFLTQFAAFNLGKSRTSGSESEDKNGSITSPLAAVPKSDRVEHDYKKTLGQ